MTVMRKIAEHKAAVADACRELAVERLGVFGSATGPEFGPQSDIDVVALFDRAPGRMFSRYFELKERLERIFERPVEIVLEDSIKNPYFREAVERSRVIVYGV